MSRDRGTSWGLAAVAVGLSVAIAAVVVWGWVSTVEVPRVASCPQAT